MKIINRKIWSEMMNLHMKDINNDYPEFYNWDNFHKRQKRFLKKYEKLCRKYGMSIEGCGNPDMQYTCPSITPLMEDSKFVFDQYNHLSQHIRFEENE